MIIVLNQPQFDIDDMTEILLEAVATSTPSSETQSYLCAHVLAQSDIEYLRNGHVADVRYCNIRDVNKYYI